MSLSSAIVQSSEPASQPELWVIDPRVDFTALRGQKYSPQPLLQEAYSFFNLSLIDAIEIKKRCLL